MGADRACIRTGRCAKAGAPRILLGADRACIRAGRCAKAGAPRILLGAARIGAARIARAGARKARGAAAAIRRDCIVGRRCEAAIRAGDAPRANGARVGMAPRKAPRAAGLSRGWPRSPASGARAGWLATAPRKAGMAWTRGNPMAGAAAAVRCARGAANKVGRSGRMIGSDEWRTAAAG